MAHFFKVTKGWTFFNLGTCTVEPWTIAILSDLATLVVVAWVEIGGEKG